MYVRSDEFAFNSSGYATYPLQGNEQLVQAYIDGGSNLDVSKNTGLGYWLLINEEYANMNMYVIMVFLINEE